jgi:hypothetical protein
MACSSTMKMEPICLSETSGCLRITRLYNPEDRTFVFELFASFLPFLYPVHARITYPNFAVKIKVASIMACERRNINTQIAHVHSQTPFLLYIYTHTHMLAGLLRN